MWIVIQILLIVFAYLCVGVALAMFGRNSLLKQEEGESMYQDILQQTADEARSSKGRISKIFLFLVVVFWPIVLFVYIKGYITEITQKKKEN